MGISANKSPMFIYSHTQMKMNLWFIYSPNQRFGDPIERASLYFTTIQNV